jgi:hypothetical protein
MSAAPCLLRVLAMDHVRAGEVSKMMAWTIRAVLIPVLAVLMFWAFSSIAIWATGGTPRAVHTAPVVVPSPERPCVPPGSTS